jgi:TonB family protein
MRTKTHWLPSAAAAAALCLAAGRAAADAIVTADHVDRTPVVVSQEAPVYPFSLRLTGNKGEVVVDFIIDPEGNVVSADVSRSSHPDFEAPAVEAVLKWRFKPGLKDGHPVYVHMRVPIYFQLTMRAEDERLPDRFEGGAEPWVIPARAPKEAPPDFQYDEAPKPLLASAPVYPYDLLVRKVKGKASVTFVVDTLGRPHVIRVDGASLPEFGASAAAMIEAWKFEPARKKGAPCLALLRKDQVFELDAEDFPINDSAKRLLKVLRKTPCPILADFRELDAPLKGRFTPSPVVPESVRSANARAEAVVDFIVDHAGHAQLPQVISATNPDFGWAAATAVGRWQYTTPSKNGRAVDVRVRVPLVFSAPNPAAKGS